jgi:hypothetical protein
MTARRVPPATDPWPHDGLVADVVAAVVHHRSLATLTAVERLHRELVNDRVRVGARGLSEHQLLLVIRAARAAVVPEPAPTS